MTRLAKKFGFYASVFVLVSPAVLVFLWMISLSFKNELDNTAFPKAETGTSRVHFNLATRIPAQPASVLN